MQPGRRPPIHEWCAGRATLSTVTREVRAVVEFTEVTVEDHTFLVGPDPAQRGVYRFDWLTGTPGYGFSAGRWEQGPMTVTEAEEAIRDFLAGIDPATGFLDE